MNDNAIKEMEGDRKAAILKTRITAKVFWKLALGTKHGIVFKRILEQIRNKQVLVDMFTHFQNNAWKILLIFPEILDFARDVS